ncbi:hypothetical protein KAS10_02825 [Candidatus Aerophobetes bacterium]|nr:hypothetical protein [Candidatus Aerophobetes bacterium]
MTLVGEIPSPLEVPPGCNFVSRCQEKMPICETDEPPLTKVGNDHYVWCHRYL